MKRYASMLTGVTMPLLAASPAFAVDTARTYSSGILVGIFLGFCALIVVVQLMPTIMLLIGFVRGLLKGEAKRAGNQGGSHGRGA